MELPILAAKEDFLDAIKRNKVVVVVGATGSGKTTQLPAFMHGAGFAVNGKQICVTQPRKIAAISVADFVAKQLGCKLGEKVGYQVRFDNNATSGTELRFVTDGILLKEFQTDPELSRYSVVMIDEAHERNLNIDLALGMLKDLLKRRDDLKVVIASATIDAQKFSEYFWGAPVLEVSGRTFPVDVIYLDDNIVIFPEASEELLQAIVDKVAYVHTSEAAGDILVFLPGQDEISKVIKGIEDLGFTNLAVLPVYAALSPEEQRAIFSQYPGKRKVIVATNIAETSITVDGIVYCIDSGLIKQSDFDASTGIGRLDTVFHSKAGCDQRAGRAGRTQPGICYRMFSQENFEKRPQFTKPESQRTSLAGVVLYMRSIGIKDVESFDFVDSPDREAFHMAHETLRILGALDFEDNLTEIGKVMAQLPLEPHISRMLLAAHEYGCLREVATIAASLSVRSVFVRPRGKEQEADRAKQAFLCSGSDMATLARVWEKYQESGFSAEWCFNNYLNAKALNEVRQIRQQLIDLLAYHGFDFSSNKDEDLVAKAVAVGLAGNLLRHRGYGMYSGEIRSLDDIYVHPGSNAFFGKYAWLVCSNIVETSKAYARNCSRVKPEWLLDIAPQYSHEEVSVVRYDEYKKSWVVKKSLFFKGDLVNNSLKDVSITEAKEVQKEMVVTARKKRWRLLKFEQKAVSVFARRIIGIDSINGVAYEIAPLEVYSLEREDGEYWCEIIGDLAHPKFRIFEELTSKESPNKAENGNVDVSSLAKKWGAKL